MSDELDPQLLAKWVTGRLDPAGQRVLAEWLSTDPARAAQLDELRALWRMAGDEAEARAAAPDTAEEARWAGLLHAIREGDGRPAEHRERAEHSPPLARTMEFPYLRRNRTWTWAAAAAVVLAIGGGAWVAANRSWPELAETPPPMREYRTARGERAEFRLVDGTRVMLNVASRVRVPADFGDADRTVYVDGGAYFDVVHDARRPFVVRAGDIVAKDLGTEFVVRAYPEDSHAHVIVRAGRVALRSAAARDSADQKTVEPGQVGRIDAGGRAFVQRADTTADFAWTGGTLVLDGTPLRDALPELGRWFDLEFRLADSSLGTIPLAATLTNQPTDEALHFLAGSIGLRELRRGRVVTFLR